MATSLAKSRHPLLVKYLAELATHPLRTKAITTGVLSFLQEVLGSNFAHVPVKKPSKDSPAILHVLARSHVDIKAVKMALYGFFVSAPLGHFLIGALQKAFAGKTGAKWRVLQILASNIFISPIQTATYLASIAVINGAKSADEVFKTVKGGFFAVIRISWIISPLSLTIAQNFIPMELWVPFFNAIAFVLGTYFNAKVKKMRMAAIKKEKEERERKELDSK